MLQTETPPLRVSRQLFEQITKENPGARLERAADGTLLIVPPTGFAGSRRNTKLILQLAAWNEGAGLGEVTESNGGYERPDGSIRAPDAAWVSRERLQHITEDQQETFAPLFPDFVVALRSKSDQLVELEQKTAEYLANGARLGWLIDSYERRVAIYRPDREVESLFDPETISGEDVLPGFVLRLAPIFAR